MHLIISSVLLQLLASSLALPPNSQKYRTDYEYSAKTDAFYKLHTEIDSKINADHQCAFEGASLMVPTYNEDIIQAHKMIKSFPDIGDFVWIGVDGKSHESADEQPIIDLQGSSSQEYEFVDTCDILTRDGNIQAANCFWRHPFICKVDAKVAPYDTQCRVYGSKYFYFPSVGSCYKVSLNVKTWNEAYYECNAEGAHLVVINSDAERQTVRDLVQSVTLFNLKFFVGIRANTPDQGAKAVWRTVTNESLSEAYYDVWSDSNEDLGYCGSITRTTGGYSKAKCQLTYPFICEKEVS